MRSLLLTCGFVESKTSWLYLGFQTFDKTPLIVLFTLPKMFYPGVLLFVCWQGLKLTEDCQEELLGCYNDLKQTQTSLSVIMKNLNCTYTHQVSRKQQCSDTFTWSSWANLPHALILKPIGCGTFSWIGGVWFWVSWSLDRIFFLVFWSYHRNNLKVGDFFCLWESDSWNKNAGSEC